MTVPGAPIPLGADQPTETSIRVRFSAGPSGSYPTLDWQIGYGTSGYDTPYYKEVYSGTNVITGLTPGQYYGFFVKARNASGYGAWSSPVMGCTTLAYPPDTPGASVDSIDTNTARIVVSAPAYSGSFGVDAYETKVTLNGSTVVSGLGGTFTAYGLYPATYYEYAARAHNAAGWSPWSAPQGFNTLETPLYAPAAPNAYAPTGITHTGMTFQITDGWNGGSAITGREYQCSVNPQFTGVTNVDFPPSGIVTLADLLPGTTYYWRGLTRNSIGDSPWSNVVSATTPPGALINDNGIWKLAVPYANAGGMWKPAVPYVNVAGVWKPTST